MTKKILFIQPTATPDWIPDLQAYLDSGKAADTQVDVVCLERGPKHLEYHYYEALIAGDVLHLVKKAEKDGYDGAMIACFDDPCVRESKEICNHLVVTGLAESSMHLAATLGDRFSIINARRKCEGSFRENAYRYGVIDKLASIRNLELGVHDFQNKPEQTEQRMEEEIKAAIYEDGAEVICLGCTMMFGFYKKMQEKYGVPVIDAMLVGLKYTEHLITLRDAFNWYPSKIGNFETPPIEDVDGWNLETAYGYPKVW